MERVRKQIGVPQGEALSLEKKHNSVVAVLDTGVSAHPDLAGRLLAFEDFVKGEKNPYDDHGHGTHVCGIIAGNGAASDGRLRGMSPDTHIVMGKILDHKGNGRVEHMIAGLEWILELHEQQPIDIINISAGMAEIREESKRLQVRQLIRTAWKKGILMICAAGNTGPEPGSLSTLSKMPEIIVVGCHDGDYFNDCPSCKNYSACGEPHMKKPDLVAPGTDIWSCNYQWIVPEIRKNRKVPVPYISKSGTSMATAVVSGAVALWMERNGRQGPGWTKTRLLTSCTDLGEPCYRQGWGMINVSRLLYDTKSH